MNSVPVRSDQARRDFAARRIDHWDRVATTSDRWSWSRGYHARLAQIYASIIPADERVLEIGCGQGDLLAAVRPSRGVGVDFSPLMLRRARARHPDLSFVAGDAHELPVASAFDYIILSDLLTDVWDAEQVLAQAARAMTASGRIVFNFYSHLWGGALGAAQRANLSAPRLEQSWLTVPDVQNLLRLAGFEPVRHIDEILWPIRTPVVEPLCNRVFVKTWPFRLAALTHVFVARRAAARRPALPRVSVVVPARNEAGNIRDLVHRVPDMGAGTELIFVEGHSSDDTQSAIKAAIAEHPQRDCRFYIQTGKGKGDAVRLGFAHASGDVLMILDADLTVPPEDLPQVSSRLCSRATASSSTASRLVYPMEDRRCGSSTSGGNKVFSLAVHVAARPADQRHAVRHQGPLARGLRADRRATAPTSATSIPSATSTCSSAPRGCAFTSSRCRFGTETADMAQRTSPAGVTAQYCCGCRWSPLGSSSASDPACCRCHQARLRGTDDGRTRPRRPRHDRSPRGSHPVEAVRPSDLRGVVSSHR